MRKMRANELRQMIKESLGEVQQGKRGMLSEAKTVAQYDADAPEIFRELTGRLMNADFWEGTFATKGIDKEMRTFGRLLSTQIFKFRER